MIIAKISMISFIVGLFLNCCCGYFCAISYIYRANMFMTKHLNIKKFLTNLGLILMNRCRNPSFGLATKAEGLQSYGPRGSPGVKVKRS